MTDITWHTTTIDQTARSQMKQHQPVVLWFTGLSGSGKSTIANATEQLFYQKKVHSYLLDGDNIRHGLCQDLGFEDHDRDENIRRIGEVSKLMYDAGLIVLSAFISPLIQQRQQLRQLFPSTAFVEVFIDTPLAICEQRDPKGLYQKARRGEIKAFTGISSLYEPPKTPEIHIKTEQLSVQQAAQSIVNYLTDNKKLSL